MHAFFREILKSKGLISVAVIFFKGSGILTRGIRHDG